MELLDTEHETPEDPVEVERWSEYVEKYVSNEEMVVEDLKDAMFKKPVFLARNVRQWRRRNKEQINKMETDSVLTERKTDSDKEASDILDNTENREDMSENPTAENGEFSDNGNNKEDTDNDITGDLKPAEDVDIIDNTECKFNVNSFKLVYVVNSESYLYKRMALKRARESHQKVSLKLHNKFKTWVDSWKKGNVSKDMEQRCNKWLLGETEDNRPCVTTKKEVDLPNKSPYYKYWKYGVKFDNSDMEQD